MKPEIEAKKLRKEAFERLTDIENIENVNYLHGYMTALDTIIFKKYGLIDIEKSESDYHKKLKK